MPTFQKTVSPEKQHLRGVRLHLQSAYADAGPEVDKMSDEEFNRAMNRRNLNYHEPTTVGVHQAIALLKESVPSYNEFAPRLLTSLPSDARVRLAREGSVCVYVETRRALTKEQIAGMQADEFALVQRLGRQYVYRFWWD